ncbi:hypothetical protein L873DRAFT_1793207 [Choiromyces venosus 120613-1]|uniref:Uncharacterized protein n=1 Tax=Choiromyces venosus 120613-1 TaxID=1336337 RepID=A0A3N4JJM4_9PEZI|nr:hypothetical protein L873DRAFT_1793207 [Choiromyces venosus 120613-1]
MVNVRISVRKEAEEERQEARSLLSGPIISAETESGTEVGNGTWAVNSEGTKWVTVGLNKGSDGGVEHVKNVARGPSRDNGVPAVSNPAVSLILAQRVVALATPEVAHVIWSRPGLPFESLISRRGIDAPVGTMGCHSAGTVSYKRTSTFSREERIPERLRGTRRVAPYRPNVSPPTLVKEDSWASQETFSVPLSLRTPAVY